MNNRLIHIKIDDEYKNNIYLVYNNVSKEALVIDPSCDISSIDKIIRERNLILSKIFITHTHEDHIRTVKEIVNQYDVDVFMTASEQRYYKYECENLHCLSDGEKIGFADRFVTCIETPGHTYGSACYLIDRMLFTGDTVFIEGCGDCKGEGAAADRMYDSLNKLKSCIPDATKIYPGHTYYTMPGETMGFLKNNNIYFLIDDVNLFMKYRMRNNQKGIYEFV